MQTEDYLYQKNLYFHLGGVSKKPADMKIHEWKLLDRNADYWQICCIQCKKQEENRKFDGCSDIDVWKTLNCEQSSSNQIVVQLEDV